MFGFKNYVKAESLDEAFELNQKKNNRLIGGMMWARMGNKEYDTVIDISGLGLDGITETDDEFRIGAMVTLRDLELNEALNDFSNGALKDALCGIVGVQFRNMATVGGSIYGRYGFSDVLTFFMAFDTYVSLHKGGIVALSDYAKQKPDRDIIKEIIVKKKDVKAVTKSVRISKTDFPVLCMTLCKSNDEYTLAVGARPARATVLKSKDGNFDLGSLTFGSNYRGSADYRKTICTNLLKLALKEINDGN